MKFTITYKNTKLFNVAMGNEMSVKRIREIIEETQHIPPDIQTLTHEGNVLENGKLLQQDYGVKEGSSILLSVPVDYQMNFRVYVQGASDKLLKRRVHNGYLVSKLKLSLQEETGIPVSLQALSYGSWLMEDDMTMSAYNIHHGSVIRFLSRLNLTESLESASQLSQFDLSSSDLSLGDTRPHQARKTRFVGESESGSELSQGYSVQSWQKLQQHDGPSMTDAGKFRPGQITRISALKVPYSAVEKQRGGASKRPPLQKRNLDVPDNGESRNLNGHDSLRSTLNSPATPWNPNGFDSVRSTQKSPATPTNANGHDSVRSMQKPETLHYPHGYDSVTSTQKSRTPMNANDGQNSVRSTQKTAAKRNANDGQDSVRRMPTAATPSSANGNDAVKAAPASMAKDSLRLDLRDTETYKLFREALGQQMKEERRSKNEGK